MMSIIRLGKSRALFRTFVSGLIASALAIVLQVGVARAAPAPVPAPTVSLPPNAGATFNTSPVGLARYGLVKKEFFFEGATSIGVYKSRMIVRRPLHPKHFNGTVIVEWLNASSGFDIDADFLPVLPLLVERGYAYVGVTAQQSSVNFLRNRDASRYSTLNMAESLPAQPAAFEVFAQAGRALLDEGNGIHPLGGLHVKRLIAVGQSQSSGRLTTFINDIHGLALEPVFDAFLPHAEGPRADALPSSHPEAEL